MWPWGRIVRNPSYQDSFFPGVRQRTTIWFTRKGLGCISVPPRETERNSVLIQDEEPPHEMLYGRVRMIPKIIKYAVWTGMLVSALSMSRFVRSLDAQQSGASATDALQKARVLDRLAAAMPAEHKGTAPGFVLDPAWPQPLPHHWVIGDVGGIAVDKHDHIWVYHRPRSASSTDSGMQGVAGLDAKGKPISALGFARPYGQINGCCMPAPSVLVFDKAGKLLQSWGGPGDPGLQQFACFVE